MTRRLYNTEIYKVENEVGIFGVALERIKNNINGGPRYKATIFRLADYNGYNWIAYNYTFTGHYCGDRKEAEWILNYHLKQLNKD